MVCPPLTIEQMVVIVKVFELHRPLGRSVRYRYHVTTVTLNVTDSINLSFSDNNITISFIQRIEIVEDQFSPTKHPEILRTIAVLHVLQLRSVKVIEVNGINLLVHLRHKHHPVSHFSLA